MNNNKENSLVTSKAMQ